MTEQKYEMKVWESLVSIKDYMISTLNATATETLEDGMERFNQEGWINRVWENDLFRRAHVDIVDARKTKKLFMMHVCVFPHLNSDAPIFGFDVIAGERKMTGAFMDFSPTVKADHQMIQNFSSVIERMEWKRERELPDWGKAIFSDSMMAAGNVQEQEEISRVMSLAKTMFSHYLTSLMLHSNNYSDTEAVRDAHNRYAHYQKQNPHTPRVMKSLGLNEDDVDAFIQKCLFPEI